MLMLPGWTSQLSRFLGQDDYLSLCGQIGCLECLGLKNQLSGSGTRKLCSQVDKWVAPTPCSYTFVDTWQCHPFAHDVCSLLFAVVITIFYEVFPS